MGREIRSATLRYGLALGAYLLILLLSEALERFFSLRLDPTSLIIILMSASAWYLGRGPGLLLAVLFEATLDYFSHPPFAFKSAVITFNRLVLFVSVVWFAASRRHAERELREQREWFKVTLSSIGDAVIATDIHGSINFINPVAESLTGWTMAESAGRAKTALRSSARCARSRRSRAAISRRRPSPLMSGKKTACARWPQVIKHTSPKPVDPGILTAAVAGLARQGFKRKK